MGIAGVVLAGGAGQRMGGVDKAALRVGGVTLLDRVLSAAGPACDELVVVGPIRPTGVPRVVFLTEPEPGGGPVPAILTGLAACPACDTVLVLASDLALVLPPHVRRLLASLGDDAVAAADHGGANPLLAAYRSAPLAERAARLGLGRGDRAGRLLPPAVATVELGPATFNVNRPGDLAAAEVLVGHSEQVVLTTLWLRDLVRQTAPDAVESVEDGFTYRSPTAGDVCAVVPRAADVGLVLGAGNTIDVSGPDDPPAIRLVAALRRRSGVSGPAPSDDQ